MKKVSAMIKMNYFKDKIHILKLLFRTFFILFYLLIYIVIVDSYVDGYILSVRKSFFLVSLSFWLLAVLLFFSKRLRLLIDKMCFNRKYSDYILFVFIPTGAFGVTEIIYNPFLSEVSFSRFFINYILYMGLLIGLQMLLHSHSMAYRTLLLLSWTFGVANYYVMEFKGNPLLPSDVLACKTAVMVVDNYHFRLADSIVYGTLILMLFLCIVSVVPHKKVLYTRKRLIIEAVAGIAWFEIFISIIYSITWKDLFHITLDAWSPQTSYYENGALFTFLMESQELVVTAPEGYSHTEVLEFIAQFDNENQISNTITSQPSVIVIMNESFSDLTVLGDFRADAFLDNWNNISKFIMRGNAYVSVRGGGTCNSEFEFLTGNSMANLSGGGYPYQMYNFDNVFNIASEFAQNGYKTIAIHPENRYNWNRAKVYAQYGFDQFLSIEEIEFKEYYGHYISDMAGFQQIISCYESSTEPVFIFNVTMQNHGGYSTDFFLKDTEFVQVEKRFELFEDVISYLTLIRESDRAFGILLDYFSQVKEPVILCMFGDHQPAVNDEFTKELLESEDDSLEERQKLYCVPYIVWSNYDMDIANITHDTSLNFLGANILEIAGISNPYTRFLINMQKEIPVINMYGYQTADKIWHYPDEANEMLDCYSKLQYYMLFDHSF